MAQITLQILIENSKKINSISEAARIIGTFPNVFSDVTKMPCKTYSLPATMCKTGTILRSIPDSACSGCYACPKNSKTIQGGAGGWYESDRVQEPMNHRLLQVLFNPRWTEAMIYLFLHYKFPLFRWHDSGDIQNDEHFENLCRIADAIPETKFWLPTQEWTIIEKYWIKQGKIKLNKLHPNMIIRLSARMIDGKAPLKYAKMMGVTTSRISRKEDDIDCPAGKQGNNCGQCRKCWDGKVMSVTYHFHNGHDHFMKSDFMQQVKKSVIELLDKGVDNGKIYKQVSEQYHIQNIAVRVVATKLRIEMKRKLKVLQ